MVCLICESHPDKYKCPTCRLPYCSIDCWKKHKEGAPCRPCAHLDSKVDNLCNPQPDPEQPYQHPTQHTIPKQTLERLGSSKELKSVLSNPHLRVMMTAINSSTDPSASIRAAMLEPIFIELADIALKIVEP